MVAAGCHGAYFRPVGRTLPPHAGIDLASVCPLEYYTGIVFNGEKIGFSRFSLTRSREEDGLYDIRTEAAFSLKFFAWDKTFSLKAHDRVDGELALKDFLYEYTIDGSVMIIEGRIQGDTLITKITTSGPSQESVTHITGPIRPSSALYLYPAVKGLVAGRVYEYLVYDGETRKVSQLRQEIGDLEESDLFDGQGYRVKTSWHGQEVDAWLDTLGRPLLEMTMGGIMISGLETKERAMEYLVRSAVNRSQGLVEVSLVKVQRRIEDPRHVTKLEVLFSGMDDPTKLPSDSRQEWTREGSRVRCRVRSDAAPACSGADAAAYLRASVEVPVHDRRIADLAARLGKETSGGRDYVRAVLAWMDAAIAKEGVDVFTATDVLEKGRAECQGHALLFAALARERGIPTKVAGGLVYSEELGAFLYHAWDEICIDGEWVGVDPVFGQMPPDATHIKLAEGEAFGDLMSLAGLVGRISAEIVSYEHAPEVSGVDGKGADR